MNEMFLKGGPLMWPILACSVLTLAVILYKSVEFLWAFRQLGRFARHGQEDCPPPWFLRSIYNALASGASERELSLIGTRQVRRLERGVGLLWLITGIAPLLGLTGTVTGMIKTFQVISATQGPVNPGLLANGIWEALITTAAGLLVSIPAHVAWHFLDERLSELTLSMRETVTAEQERRRNGV